MRCGRTRRLPAILLLACALGLGASPAGAIVNGTPVPAARFAAEFPWAVVLLVDGKPDAVCTGQLVSPTWVLTAAHCATPGRRVRHGDRDRRTAGGQVAVEVVRHPRYDPKTGAYDVGLLRLSEPVASVPVALPGAAGSPDPVGPLARGIIGGWGRRGASGGFSELFVASDVRLGNLQRLPDRFAFLDRVSGPCGGDSGGPLLLERPDGSRVLAGIASRVVGDLCAQGGGISIYVDVGAVRPFIEQHVADLPK